MSDSATAATTEARTASIAWAGMSAAERAVPASLLMALPGLVFLAGYDHLAYGLGLLAGVVLAGLLIAPKLVRTHRSSLPSAIGARFGPLAAGLAGLVVVAVALPLLTAELSVIGFAAEWTLNANYGASVLVAAVLVALAAFGLGEARLSTLSALAYPLLAASLIVPLVLIAAKSQGLSFPFLSFGAAVAEVRGLEEQLLESGLVDFDTFTAHATPFLRFAQLDVFALAVTLALGTAVLAHLTTALAGGKSPGEARLSGAWAALFLMCVLAAAPALAAFVKLEVYRLMVKATPLAELPPWLEAPLRSDFATVYGTSLHLLDQVVAAFRLGAHDANAVSVALAAKAPAATSAHWLALDGETQSAMIAAAKSLAADTPTASASAWDVYRSTVLPAAASAAGNDSTVLTQAALVIEPAGLLLALPGLSGAPLVVSALIAAAIFSAALMTASSLALGTAALVAVPSNESARSSRLATARGPALALVILAVATAAASLRPTDLVPIVVSALAIGAAGLGPTALVALAWRRATAPGVIAAIVVGAGVTLVYIAGTQLFPSSFYAAWPALSNAGEGAIEEFQALDEDAHRAESVEARAAAATARDALARGSKGHPGLANWAGVDSASSAVFGAPLGLIVLMIVSLVTSRRRTGEPEKP